MTKRRAFATVGAFAVLGLLSAGLLLVPLLAAGVPSGYATVVGLGIAVPAVALFGYSWTETFDSEAYYEDGTVLADSLVTALGGIVGGVVGFTILSTVAPGASWTRSLGVGCALLGGYAVFIHRNREHFAEEANPWVAGKLGEWLN
ncbi:hypothetical protein [Halorussus halophilus]|uniref:hypothetical protein n=1 Tax=Halorussus halophilus TaxID=2650975 RepID=UPI001300FEE7|nr:hypothetical protein [Halorussus halophilus]